MLFLPIKFKIQYSKNDKDIQLEKGGDADTLVLSFIRGNQDSRGNLFFSIDLLEKEILQRSDQELKEYRERDIGKNAKCWMIVSKEKAATFICFCALNGEPPTRGTGVAVEKNELIQAIREIKGSIVDPVPEGVDPILYNKFRDIVE